ncbi:hypothetical protein BJ508DRAFT_381488 [Ascobolus immersus RN42]|uniref:Uncharacterized protein n=1 Tax=Ascobolus immersus RN42 TaxID=1160509 RepID=A0A3N4HL51_ASCIM|nr:hypothetical protein BJ508DRAFT_381488 [Ascobolus immersus RN42]
MHPSEMARLYMQIKTPLWIIMCFVGGLLSATIHLLLFRWLDQKRPSDTIPQEWVQIISTVLAYITRSLLGASLGLAYVQHIWKKLRRVFLSAKRIDQLLSLPWSPIDLFNLKMMRKITMWKTPSPLGENPALYRGQNTSYQVQFTGPKLKCTEIPVDITELQQTIFGGARAQASLGNLTDVKVDDYQFALFSWRADRSKEGAPFFDVWYRQDTSISASAIDEANVTSTQSNLSCTRCLLGTADYTVEVINSVGQNPSKVTYTIKEDSFQLTTNSTESVPKSLYYFFFTDSEGKSVSASNPSRVGYNKEEQGNPSNPDGYPFWKRFLEVQSIAIFRAYANSLQGRIHNFGLGWVYTSVDRTNILATNLAEVSYDIQKKRLRLQATPAMLEQAFENVTVSLPMMGLEGWNTSVPIKVHQWANVYEFNAILLLGPYGGAILISFIFGTVGLFALRHNGWVSAKGNSFLQVATTISAPEATALREEAAKCDKGGEENFSKDLLKLELRFGQLIGDSADGSVTEMSTKSVSTGYKATEVARVRQRMGPASGFGTADELVPMEGRWDF